MSAADGVKGAAGNKPKRAASSSSPRWTEFQTPEGGTYYFNERSGEMSWSRPAALGGAGGGGAGGGAGGVARVLAPAFLLCGRVLFFAAPPRCCFASPPATPPRAMCSRHAAMLHATPRHH